MPVPTNDNARPDRERRRQPPPREASRPGYQHHDEEPRTFDTDAPPGGHMGAGGDPSEGKRD